MQERGHAAVLRSRQAAFDGHDWDAVVDMSPLIGVRFPPATAWAHIIASTETCSVEPVYLPTYVSHFLRSVYLSKRRCFSYFRLQILQLPQQTDTG